MAGRPERHEYRVSWMQAAPRVPGVVHADEDLTLGVASRDVEALRAWVLARDWPEGTSLVVGAASGSGVDAERSVECAPSALRTWRPDRDLLPKGHTPRPKTPSRGNPAEALLRAMRRAVDAAVAANALSGSEGAALMLGVRDLLDRHAAEPLAVPTTAPVRLQGLL